MTHTRKRYYHRKTSGKRKPIYCIQVLQEEQLLHRLKNSHNFELRLARTIFQRGNNQREVGQRSKKSWKPLILQQPSSIENKTGNVKKKTQIESDLRLKISIGYFQDKCEYSRRGNLSIGATSGTGVRASQDSRRYTVQMYEADIIGSFNAK